MGLVLKVTVGGGDTHEYIIRFQIKYLSGVALNQTHLHQNYIFSYIMCAFCHQIKRRNSHINGYHLTAGNQLNGGILYELHNYL